MKLEVGQVWYASDGHLEIIVKIDEDAKIVHALCYENGSVKALPLDYAHDPIDVVALDGDDVEFELATTLNDILEICTDERR